METEALQGPGLIFRQPAVGVWPAVSGSVYLTRALRRDGAREGEGRDGGQELSCVARADYACCGAGFLDVVFVLERMVPGRCCK